MAEKIDSWRTKDGLIFDEERKAVTHEVLTDLFAVFPELKSSRDIIEPKLDQIAEILRPVVNLNTEMMDRGV